MIVLLLVLKLLVSSHPLNFEGVLAFMFFYSIRTCWVPLCYVYSMLKQTVAFNALLFMILCLSYSSCYNIVAKFNWIISIMPMLEYLDPSSQCFTCLIKIVLASCHLKNYFVITYLLEDEQELSLGMLIRLKRIYNFWWSMLVLHQFICVLFTLRCTFTWFPALTY